MMTTSPNLWQSRQDIRKTLHRSIQQLAPHADAIFAREPLLDPHTPMTSDLDLLVFGPVEELLPQRLQVQETEDCHPMVDLIWLPTSFLDQPEYFARQGVLPHRLLSSSVIYDSSGYATQQCKKVRRKMYDNTIQQDRITGFMDMGFYTVREIGVTWDFPALAMFWLHVAFAACLASMCDGIRHLCPNIYTRPSDYVKILTQHHYPLLEKSYIETLRLDGDMHAIIESLRRIYTVVAQQFPEPCWPSEMRQTTRYEYRYFSDRRELDWRISVAYELVARGNAPAAIFYLRFWAYSLARIPMVYQRAQEGCDVSFMRPARAVRPDLEQHCPEILDDLTRIWGGMLPISVGEVTHSLDRLLSLRKNTLAFLKNTGITLKNLRDWRPHRPPHDDHPDTEVISKSITTNQ